MKKFTTYLCESKNINNQELTSEDIQDYLKDCEKKLTIPVIDTIRLTDLLGIYNATDLEEIKNSSKSSINALSKKFKVSSVDMENLWDKLKSLKASINLLPQYMSKAEMNALKKGNLTADDITIDLSSDRGRNAAAKMYIPYIRQIASKYVGKSRLSFEDLLSTAMEAMTDAMNKWKRFDDKGNTVTFKTFLGYRVQQTLLNDMGENGHTASGFSSEQYRLGKRIYTNSIDNSNDEEGQNAWYNMLNTSDSQRDMADDEWKDVYALIERNFNMKDVSIFYKKFGLKDHKQMKSVEIAREMKVTESAISQTINKIIRFLKTDRKAQKAFRAIADTYNESLLLSLFGMSKEFIMESLIKDDTFILLEELNRWGNKDVFIDTLDTSLNKLNGKDKKLIENILEGDFETLDSNFKKNKHMIIEFLSHMYPTEPMLKKSDVSLLDYMSEIQDYYQEYK